MHFDLLDSSLVRKIVSEIEEEFGEEAAECAEDSLVGALGFSAAEGVEIAAAYLCGCVLFRVFEDGYAFTCPVAVGETSDLRGAFFALAEYCRRELLPFLITDVERETLSLLCELFLHVDARAYDDEDDYFVVQVRTECDRLSSLPELFSDGVSLSELTEEDCAGYFKLCTDPCVNKYWGYDYREDSESPAEDFFLRMAESERQDGVALSVAVRYDGAFVGEGVIFDFDYVGGASVGIRILPEFWGRGIGTRALSLLIGLAREMGLKKLSCQVMNENIASLRLIGKAFEKAEASRGKQCFVLSLN